MKGLITVAIYIIISSFVDTSYLHSRTAKAILTFTQKKKKNSDMKTFRRFLFRNYLSQVMSEVLAQNQYCFGSSQLRTLLKW